MTDTKLTLTQSGAEDGAAAPKKDPGVVTDARGRAFTLKKPSALEQYRFVRFIGDVSDRYLGMVTPLMWIRAINGEPQAQPNSQRELDALIQALGDEGIEAVMDGVLALAQGEGVDEAALKN